MNSENIEQALQELEKTYKEIPQHNCANCGGCCGPVQWTPLEDVNIRRYLEAQGIEYRKRESDIPPEEMTPEQLREFLSCPYREEGKCLIYPVRPAVCRLFGVAQTQRLFCPKRVPYKAISQGKASRIMARVINLSLEAIPPPVTVESLKAEIKQVIKEKDAALAGQDYGKAVELRERQERLLRQKDALERELGAQKQAQPEENAA